MTRSMSTPDTLGTVAAQSAATEGRHRVLAVPVIAYAVFFAVSVVGRLTPNVFDVVMCAGIAFPLVWAAVTRDWVASGFTRRNWKPALAWGAGVGIALGGLVYVALAGMGKQLAPNTPAVRVLIGILLAFLVISPFQEFFFRGWLQPRLQSALGRWMGLLVCSLAFAVWDVMPPLNQPVSVTTAVATLGLIPASFSLAVVFGYVFQRTGNLLAPWLAHSIVVLALLATGQWVP